MSSHPSVIFVVLVAAAASAEVLNKGDCPKTFPKEMTPLYKCCKMQMNPNINVTVEQRAALDFCMNGTKTIENEVGAAGGGYGCFTECLFIKLGLMGEDKTYNTEKVLEVIKEEFHEDFIEPASNALATCVEKKYPNVECPSGIDGVLRCFYVQVLLNCPAKYWTSGEECKGTRNFMQKCGDNTDYVEDE